ncbi:Protein often near L-alanine-DL-glutamate epimerase (cell wall recycling) [Rhodovulum sp. P5]|uniref:DUF1611 domain-containing protein n=1 Tax=Rhodovulum sp. P5 TaxID=1564506 RepID=UPI0009C2B8B4|nr:DUF1611 domain-containing protein [Rhodovulum sp. P5]ARE41163.1 Protein often near L-alanine-DL-glutamate epimerase (cell wall recycling) [Rhodovulum sp. P5]
MLDPTLKIALYAEATMGLLNAKMTEGIIRYGQNPVVAVIDSHAAGRSAGDFFGVGHDIPVLATLDEAIAKGAQVLVLGTAPSGGRIPPEWMAMLRSAVGHGLNIVNGLHDPLMAHFGDSLKPGQWIWDIRTPMGDLPPIATARAATLNNLRVLMVGTDMAVGKMTAGLEVWRSLLDMGQDAVFLATGQIGVSITGGGIPLDAYRVDHASGAVERMVMEAGHHAIQIIEGQGSLLHPGSTATLPLLRGSCANRMILCHRAGMVHLDTMEEIKVPPLADVIALNEALANAAGALTPARVVGVAVNTRALAAAEAEAELDRLSAETGLPVVDPVRHGGRKLAEALLSD